MDHTDHHHDAEAAQAPAEVCKCLGITGCSCAVSMSIASSLTTVWRLQILPLNRIKRLMKEETDVKAVSAEASYAAARATVRAAKVSLGNASSLHMQLC